MVLIEASAWTTMGLIYPRRGSTPRHSLGLTSYGHQHNIPAKSMIPPKGKAHLRVPATTITGWQQP